MSVSQLLVFDDKVFIELIEYFSILWLSLEHRNALVIHSNLQGTDNSLMLKASRRGIKSVFRHQRHS
jgi:hypothetical protein